MATKEDWIALVGGMEEAVNFEGAALSVETWLLPPIARVVRDGGEDTPEYWEWLISEWTKLAEEDQ